MSVLKVDGLEISIAEGGLVWYGPAEYTDDEGQAVCCDWEIVPEGLQAAFLALQGKWSEMMKAFMEDNRVALGVLKSQVHEEYRLMMVR